MNFRMRGRFLFIGIAVGLVFAILVLGLYHLTVLSSAEVSANLSTSAVREVTTAGKRGSVLDINGTPLAYDDTAYNVQFLKDASKVLSSDKAHYTQILIRTVEIIEENGFEVIDTFDIVRTENGAFDFSFSDSSLSVRQTKIKNWLINMAIPESLTDPEQIYYELRTRYRIPEEMPYEEARKLLSIWQEVQLISSWSYLPVNIAYDVDFETVAQLEARSDVLEGIQISESTKRVYPQGEIAAHLIGYTGRISDAEQLEALEEKGYTAESLIGKTGIEYSMEDYLTAETADKRGKKEIRVNTNGVVLETLSESLPKNGNNVILNIDLELENVLMEALRNNVERVRQEQESEYAQRQSDPAASEKLKEQLGNRAPDFCNSGAAIVVDIDTLDVMAMGSYPSFDLNEFVGGISQEKLTEWMEDEATPLFDKTIQSRSTPGSIFKPLTAIAGLMEGVITLEETIDDEGPYTKYITDGSEAPDCWIRDYRAHKAQDVIKAIKNSCNYYFYVVADRLKIETLCLWADKFGVTSKTGIELPYETTGIVGNQTVLYNGEKKVGEQVTSMPRLVYSAIKNKLASYGRERNVEYTNDQLSRAAEKIVALAGMGNQQHGEQIRRILSNDLEIPESYSNNKGWDNELNAILLELIWDGTDTVTTGIGTNITQLTPIAIVRYLATILNGGKLMVPHLVNRVVSADGEIICEVEPELLDDLAIKQEYIDAVKEGMKEVTLTTDGGGTAAKVFRDFEYLGQFGGKSGTAPVSNLDLEDNGWFIAFAPFDEPEIAIVVFLPHGASGSNAGYAVRDILQYYFDKKAQADEGEEKFYTEGSLLP